MDRNVINNIKSLSLDMINKANSGHPGIVLGAAPIIYTLFSRHLIANPYDEKWVNRDRFVLSAGHGSALLYSTLFMGGYDLNINDLKNFRQIGSNTPGHPEYNLTKGVEATTGPLGQGLAMAVGLAVAEKKLEIINKAINYKVYVLCSDGDLMEGISYEACSLAGSLKLNNLIVLYDSNNISLDGSTKNVFNEDVLKRFEAQGWATNYVKDGNDLDQIDLAIAIAKQSDKPTLIKIDTIIGQDSIYQNTSVVHGKSLDKDDLFGIKTKLGVDQTAFYIDDDAKEYFKNQILTRSIDKYNAYNTPDISKLNVDLSSLKGKIENDELRKSNGKIISYIGNLNPRFISGSADLATSTKTDIVNQDKVNDVYSGQNISFGVREHAMGAIANGLALSGFYPVISTFLTFADYLKPSLRLSALMNLPVTYVFTHDSIAIGQDGPTHQPVEQLVSLRSIPNLNVFRPCDYNELIGAWEYITAHHNPNALVVTKDVVPTLADSSTDISKGAYIIRREIGKLHGVIIATGSEVHTALQVASKLYDDHKLDLRVVSMPAMNLYIKQTKEYQESILPTGYRVVAIEFGSSFSWYKFVYNENYLINVNNFGKSGKPNDVTEAMHLDFNSICQKIEKLFK